MNAIEAVSKMPLTGVDAAPAFAVDEGDPLSRFIRLKLGWSWLHILVLAFLVYGPIEKLAIPALGGYLQLNGPVGQWRPDIVGLLTGFLIYPLVLVFYIWSATGTANIFVSLWRNRIFLPPEPYATQFEEIRELLNRPIWSVLSLILSLVIISLVHFVLWAPDAKVEIWFGAGNTPHRVLALALIGLVGYAIGQVLTRHLLIIVCLWRLFDKLGGNLILHPYHADGAGGLGAIGQYALRLSLLLALIMIYIVVGSFLPSLQEGGELAVELWNPAVTVAWIVYLVIVPLSYFSLLLPAHVAMLSVRNAQLNQASAQLDDQLIAARQSAAGDRENLPVILKEIENLKSIRAIILQDYPTWPVSASLLRRLSVSTFIPPALHLIFSLVLDAISG